MPEIRIKRLPLQKIFYECNDKWSAARGGVGSGKTTAAVYWMIKRLTRYPKAGHFVMGADYEQLRRGFFQTVLGIFDMVFGWEQGVHYRYRDNPTPMVTLLKGPMKGARLRSVSAETLERVRSLEMQSVVCEEPQTWASGKKVYDALFARVRHSLRSGALYPEMEPQGRLTFNPPAVGHWLHELCENVWPKLGYKCLRFSLRDNTLLVGLASYLKGLEAQYSPDRQLVEIDGHWGTAGGDVYRNFDLKIHTVAPPTFPPIALDPTKRILWAHDFNVGMMCSVLMQAHVQPIITEYRDRQDPLEKVPEPNWQRRTFYAVREIALRNAGAEDVAERFITEYGEIARKVGVTLYGDVSGGARSQVLSSHAAARTPWEAIMNALTAARIPWDIVMPTANPPQLDRIYAFNAQFRSGDGFGFLVDAVACPELVHDFRAVKFKEGTNEIEKKTKPQEEAERTHMSDAAGYLLWAERQLLRDPGAVEWTMAR